MDVAMGIALCAAALVLGLLPLEHVFGTPVAGRSRPSTSLRFASTYTVPSGPTPMLLLATNAANVLFARPMNAVSAVPLPSISSDTGSPSRRMIRPFSTSTSSVAGSEPPDFPAIAQVVTFAMMFAIALAQVHGHHRDTMVGFCESLTEVMFKFVGVVMKFAPLGIGAAMAVTVGHSGLGVLLNLGKLVLTLYGALLVFCVFVLVPVAWWARVPVVQFLRLLREPIILAFTTTSSDAAMPGADLATMPGADMATMTPDMAMPMGCSLQVTVTTVSPGGKYSPRNIGAIWISDGSDRFIKTLNVWADRRAKYLKRWNTATSAAMLPANRVDAISSATKSSHGVRTGTWNCKNTAAMPVADGSYKVCFELTDYDGDGPYNCVPFTKSTAPFTLTPADAPSFTARKLELTR